MKDSKYLQRNENYLVICRSKGCCDWIPGTESRKEQESRIDPRHHERFRG